MKLCVVTSHLPQIQGVAAGRLTRALGEGLVSDGHQIEVVSYSPETAREEIPGWCRVVSIEKPSWLRSKVRAVAHPRGEAAQLGLDIPDDTVALADEYFSYPAIALAARRALVVHHRTLLDVLAVRRPVPRDLQSWRAESMAVHDADLLLATSSRVTASLPDRAVLCPVGYPYQDELPAVDAPVAAVLGDWRWAPNQWALDRLLRMWHDVRDLVPAARLLVAGHGSTNIGTFPGVTPLGRVASSLDVLAGCAVVPFPCPGSTGPKVKLLDALSVSRPILTTPSGLDGISAGIRSGEMTSGLEVFARNLADLLNDPGRGAELGRSGRASVRQNHSPVLAARRLVQACYERFGELTGGSPGGRSATILGGHREVNAAEPSRRPTGDLRRERRNPG